MRLMAIRYTQSELIDSSYGTRTLCKLQVLLPDAIIALGILSGFNSQCKKIFCLRDLSYSVISLVEPSWSWILFLYAVISCYDIQLTLSTVVFRNYNGVISVLDDFAICF